MTRQVLRCVARRRRGMRDVLGATLAGMTLAAGVADAQPAPNAMPVLLVHGIWSNCSTWDDVVADLIGSGFTEGPDMSFAFGSSRARFNVRCRLMPQPATGLSSGGVASNTPTTAEGPMYAAITGGLTSAQQVVVRLTLESSAGQTYQVQGEQVAAAVAYLREWTGAPKVIIVGHSMGGLAARAYLQGPGYREDVGALITVATPHGGSPLGDMPRSAMSPACRDAAQFKGMSWDDPAVRNLMPDSRELGQLNQGLGPYNAMPKAVRIVGLLSAFQASSGHADCWTSQWMSRLTSSWTSRLTGDLQLRATQASAGFTFSAGVTRLHSDGVVPFVAQHPLFAAAISPSQVRVEAIEGYHSAVLHDDGPRRAVVAAIVAEAGGGKQAATTNFEGRTVTWQGEVSVGSEEVTFELWDNAQIDGDRVTLVVNGERVLSDRELSGTRHGVRALLRPGENVVFLVAENEGRVSPNTAALSVTDVNGRSRTLVLRADLKTTAAYRVVVTR